VNSHRTLRWYDHILINIYWLGLNIASGSLTPYILPVLVVLLVGEANKNTALGDLRAWGLLVAILIQPTMGLLSDRSPARWGRRRPFIVAGTLFDLVFLVLLGLAGLHWKSYALLFAALMLLQTSSNVAHGALQGLIPDLVPEDQRGRSSGVKALFELLPIILVGFTIAKVVETNTWVAIIAVMIALALGMVLTLPVREEPLRQKVEAPLGPALTRIALLTLIFGLVWQASRRGLEFVIAALQGTGATQLVIVALTGLVAMVASIVVGVWWSARVGVGEGARKYPSFTWWVINRLLYLAAVGSIQGFALYFLRDVLHVPDAGAATGSLMVAVGIFTLLATLPSGFLSDRFGRKTLVAASGVVAALGTGLLLVSTHMSMVLVSGVLIGIASGTFMTVNWALGTDLVPKEEAGRYLGVSNLAGAGAGVVGAGLGGPLADFFNLASPGLGYLVIFAIYGVCFLLSAVSLRWVQAPAVRS